MSREYRKNERTGHTLQATALVNEVYLRLIDVTAVDWKERAHFFAVCAQIMRRLLVDAARARRAGKRGGGAVVVHVDDAPVLAPERDAAISPLTTLSRPWQPSTPAKRLSSSCVISAALAWKKPQEY